MLQSQTRNNELAFDVQNYLSNVMQWFLKKNPYKKVSSIEMYLKDSKIGCKTFSWLDKLN